MNRRRVLLSLGLGSASLALFPRLALPLASASPAPGGRLIDLATRFRETPRDEILLAGARAAREGGGFQAVLGGAFLAGIHDVRPRHVGGKLHCVMMVESAFQICEALPDEEALLLSLWALDDFKRSQARDEREGGWVLPPSPAVSYTNEAAARREFLAAMAEGDDEKADRAVVGLIPFHGRRSLYEILWPLAARSFVNIGHKIIYGAQIERVLRRLPWSEAEAPLRSLVHGLLHSESGDLLTSVWESSRRLAPRIPPGWLEGKEDPEASRGIMRDLRAASSSTEGQMVIIESFKAGLGPATVWDGLRLAASEIFMRRPAAPPDWRQSLLPVHAVTITESFSHAFRSTASDETKRLMILQAGGWLPDMREALVQRKCHVRDGVELDSMGEEPGTKAPALGEALKERDPFLVRAALSASPGSAGKYIDGIRRHLARRGVEHHQHKYAAAFLEESRRIHPRWAPAILAPAVNYLPTEAVAETDVARRSREAIRKAFG